MVFRDFSDSEVYMHIYPIYQFCTPTSETQQYMYVILDSDKNLFTELKNIERSLRYDFAKTGRACHFQPFVKGSQNGLWEGKFFSPKNGRNGQIFCQ